MYHCKKKTKEIEQPERNFSSSMLSEPRQSKHLSGPSSHWGNLPTLWLYNFVLRFFLLSSRNKLVVLIFLSFLFVKVVKSFLPPPRSLLSHTRLKLLKIEKKKKPGERSNTELWAVAKKISGVSLSHRIVRSLLFTPPLVTETWGIAEWAILFSFLSIEA